MKKIFDFLFRRKPQAEAGQPVPPPPAPAATAPLDVPLTAPLSDLAADLHPIYYQRGRPGSPRLRVGHAQDVGKVRSHNEDVLLAISSAIEGLIAQPAFGLFIIADGMGGHSLGERASAVASRTIARELMAQLYLPHMINPDPDDTDRPSLNDVMRLALEHANRAVASAAPDGGTTGTAALLLGDRVTIAHVGDSRVYLIMPNSFEKLTRDHSLVERLQELGQLSPEEAAAHPQKNVLYRALGQGEGLEVDVTSYQLPVGARLLLCSDGLWGYIPEDLLVRTARQARTPQDACDQLVQAANDAGGPDNISAIVVELAY